MNLRFQMNKLAVEGIKLIQHRGLFFLAEITHHRKKDRYSFMARPNCLRSTGQRIQRLDAVHQAPKRTDRARDIPGRSSIRGRFISTHVDCPPKFEPPRVLNYEGAIIDIISRENAEIERVVGMVSAKTEGRGVWVMDRGLGPGGTVSFPQCCPPGIQHS